MKAHLAAYVRMTLGCSFLVVALGGVACKRQMTNVGGSYGLLSFDLGSPTPVNIKSSDESFNYVANTLGGGGAGAGLALQGGMKEVRSAKSLRAGMNCMLTISYGRDSAGQPAEAGQRAFSTQRCLDMPDPWKSREDWDEDEICAIPGNNSTTQAVQLPGQSFGDGDGGSMMSVTELLDLIDELNLNRSNNLAKGAGLALLDEEDFKGEVVFAGGTNANTGDMTISGATNITIPGAYVQTWTDNGLSLNGGLAGAQTDTIHSKTGAAVGNIWGEGDAENPTAGASDLGLTQTGAAPAKQPTKTPKTKFGLLDGNAFSGPGGTSKFACEP